jgi:hypothetical protein
VRLDRLPRDARGGPRAHQRRLERETSGGEIVEQVFLREHDVCAQRERGIAVASRISDSAATAASRSPRCFSRCATRSIQGHAASASPAARQ